MSLYQVSTLTQSDHYIFRSVLSLNIKARNRCDLLWKWTEKNGYV